MRMQLTDEKAIGAQIADHIRRRILSGEWAPGFVVPSTRDLSKEMRVAPMTVQAGMRLLVKEGLIMRITGRGSFVRDVKTRLSCIGVYESLDIGKNEESAFGRRLLCELSEVMKEAGIDMKVWVDTRRSLTEKDKALPELAAACSNGEIQGLIVPGSWWGQMRWLDRLPVPVTIMGGANRPNVVSFDTHGFVKKGVEELARQGCRSMGAILLMAPRSRDPDTDHPNAFETLMSAVKEAKLNIRPSWIRMPTSDRQKVGPNMRYGYMQFKSLWQESEHPDGLLVFDDVAAQGVVTAMLEERVKAPDELKLVLHRHPGITHFCPVSAGYLEVSTRVVAKTLVAHVSRQFYDRQCERGMLQFQYTSDAE